MPLTFGQVTWRVILTPAKSLHEIALTARESSDNLSALSKHAYGQLFSWIVGFINRCHLQHVQGLNSNSNRNGNGENAEGMQEHAGEVTAACAKNRTNRVRRLTAESRMHWCVFCVRHPGVVARVSR